MYNFHFRKQGFESDLTAIQAKTDDHKQHLKELDEEIQQLMQNLSKLS